MQDFVHQPYGCHASGVQESQFGVQAVRGVLPSYRGLNNYQYYLGGVPYYKYSIMGPKTHSND